MMKGHPVIVALVVLATLALVYKLMQPKQEGYGVSPYSAWMAKLATEMPSAYQSVKAVKSLLADIRDQLLALEDQTIPCSSITRYIDDSRIGIMLPLASSSELRKTVYNIRSLILRVEGENCVQSTTTPARAASHVQLLMDSA